MPKNLLKIPAYFFYNHQGVTNKLSWIQKLNHDVSQAIDLDITLLTYKNFLLEVHTQFFKNFEQKVEKQGGMHSGMFTDIRYYIDRCKKAIFKDNLTAKLSFRYFLSWHQTKANA